MKDAVYQIVDSFVKEESMFLVDLEIKPTNKITIIIDSESGATIDDCIKLNRLIEQKLDREVEDFELQISSPGLDQPFKVYEQYKKNHGKSIEVVTRDGMKRKGALLKADLNEIVLDISKKVKGKGKKEEISEQLTISFDEIKSAKTVISFK